MPGRRCPLPWRGEGGTGSIYWSAQGKQSAHGSTHGPMTLTEPSAFRKANTPPRVTALLTRRSMWARKWCWVDHLRSAVDRPTRLPAPSNLPYGGGRAAQTPQRSRASRRRGWGRGTAIDAPPITRLALDEPTRPPAPLPFPSGKGCAATTPVLSRPSRRRGLGARCSRRRRRRRLAEGSRGEVRLALEVAVEVRDVRVTNLLGDGRHARISRA